MTPTIFWELFSLRFMRWDVFAAWYDTPRGRKTGIFGDKYDWDVWFFGRVNIIISDEVSTDAEREAYRKARGLDYWG